MDDEQDGFFEEITSRTPSQVRLILIGTLAVVLGFFYFDSPNVLAEL